MGSGLSNRAAKVREWLARDPFARLVLHFYNGFFTGELFSADSNLRLGIGGILVLLVLPGLVLPLMLLPKYSSFLRWLEGQRQFDYNLASLPDKYLLLALTMVVTGIVAVLKWDSLFPDRLDSANLSPLPVPARRIFAAKFIALMLFVGLFVVALNAVSTFLFPLVVLGEQGNFRLWLRFVLAHAIVTAAGSYFMFFLFFALVGLLMLVLPARPFRQISTALQIVFVISLLIVFFATPEIGALLSRGSAGVHSWLNWLPTVWFLGLYQQLLGRADAGFDALAIRAAQGLAAVVVASLGFYAASYGRYYRRIPEAVELAAAARGAIQGVVAPLFSPLAFEKSPVRACFKFGMKTLVRSPLHRFLLAGCVGFGVAIAIEDVAVLSTAAAKSAPHLPAATLLSLPLVIAFFLISGLRFIFNLPAELPANWAFQLTVNSQHSPARRSAKILMLAFLAPVILATAVVYSALWGTWLGLAHAAFVLLVSLILADGLLVSYRKIPFTCSYSAGKHNPGMVLAAYLFAFLFFSSGLAHLEHWALSWPSWLPFFVLMMLFTVCWTGLRIYASGSEPEEQALIFADEPEPFITMIDLR
jgi:hypothetical protein